MKKILLVVVAFCQVVFFYGCKEKPTNQKQATSIEGIWAGQDYSTDVANASSQIIQAGKEYTKATTYTFNGDGTFIEKVAAFESNGNWALKTDSLTLEYVVKQGPQDRKENKYKVVTQNDSLLVLEFKLQEYGVEHYTFRRKN